MKQAESIKDATCNKRLKRGEFLALREARWETEIIIYNCPEHGKCLCPMNLMTCVLDNLQSEFSLYLYCFMSDFLKRDTQSYFYQARKLVIGLKDLRDNIGEVFFKIMSLWEPFVIGFVVKDREHDVGFRDLYDSTLEELETNLSVTNFKKFTKLATPSNHSHQSLKFSLQFPGMAKCFGHPCIDSQVAFETLKENSTKPAQINTELVKLIHGVFQREIMFSYKNKHGRWPLLEFMPKGLLPYLLEGKEMTQEIKSSLTLWHEIEFHKNFEYNYNLDTSELLKDSALAPPLSQWFTQYDHCAFKNLYGKNKPKLTVPKQSTRVLQRYLEGSEYEAKIKLLNLQNNYLDLDDSIAVVCRKERELKLQGRSFLKQTYVQRLAQTSMEMNLSETILKYFKDQTMTSREIDQLRRMSSAATGQKKNLEVLNLDLSKWNSTFRHLLVYMFGRSIDQLFGIKHLYENNHWWFLTCHVFTNSRLCPPDYDPTTNMPIPGPFYYNDHRGGFEGMRQKFWTIITIAVIRYTAETMRLSISLLCQGDNQVVLLKYRQDQLANKEEIRHRFLNEMKQNFSDINLKLKLEETWYSQRLFEYGKQRFLDGVMIGQGIKKATRVIPDINDGLSTFQSGLSTINTITESIAKVDIDPDPAFFLNQFHILNYLARKKVFSIKDHDSDILPLLFHPSDFGGIPLSPYLSHWVRGLDDKVTVWLGAFCVIKRKFPSLFQKILTINQFTPTDSNQDLRPLIEDIYTLNTKKLPSMDMKFKEIAEEYLNSPEVTNPEFTRLLNPETCLTEEGIKNELIGIVPFYPALASDLFKYSNAGTVKSLRNKFTKIQSLADHIQNTAQRDLLLEAKIVEQEAISILRERITRPRSLVQLPLFKVDCLTQIAKDLRILHYGQDLLDVTKPYPLHQLRIEITDEVTNKELECSICITLSREYAEVMNPAFLGAGPFTPYYGSVTREKIKRPSMESFVKTSNLKALQQLVMIKSWLIRLNCENLITLVNKLIYEKQLTTVTNVDLEHPEDWCTTNNGGNMIHRFRSMMENKSALINHLPLTSSHIVQSTNLLNDISLKGEDYTIHYQLLLLTNTIRIAKIKRYCGLNITSFNAILCCNDCTDLVSNVQFDMVSESKIVVDEVTDKMTIFRETLQINHKLTKNEILRALSLLLGNNFGEAFDREFNDQYHELHIRTELPLAGALSNVSVNDFRYINFTYLIVGCFQRSFKLRSLVLKHSELELLSLKLRGFDHLATYLMNANRVREFLIYVGVSVTEHSQYNRATDMGCILARGIISYFFKNRNILFPMILTTFLSDFDLSRRRDTIAWTIKLAAKLRIITIVKKIDLLNILDVEIQTRIFIRDGLKLGNLMHLASFQNINSQEVVQYFRFELAKGELIPFQSLEDDIIVKLCKPADLRVEEFNAPIGINYIMYNRFIREFYHSFLELANLEQEIHIKNFHHIMRLLGSISSAGSKIYEVLCATGLLYEQILVIICLAEGSGGILKVLMDLFPNARCEYNSLLDPEIDKRASADFGGAPGLLNSQVVGEYSFPHKRELTMGETNILKEKFHSKIRSVMSDYEVVDLMTIDAEAKNNDPIWSLMFLKDYIRYVEQGRVKVLIVKVLLTSETLNSYTRILAPSPVKYTMVKPISSHPNNNEVYIVLKLLNTLAHLNVIFEHTLRTFIQFVLPTLGTKPLRTEERNHKYINVCVKVQKLIYPDFEEKNVVSDDLSIFGIPLNDRTATCSLYCTKVISLYLMKASKLSGITNVLSDTIILGNYSGITRSVQQDLYNAIFIILILSYPTQTALSLMEKCTVNLHTFRNRLFSVFSFETTQNAFDDWNDSKAFFRRLLVRTRCTCGPRIRGLVHSNLIERFSVALREMYDRINPTYRLLLDYNLPRV